ncbi:MAG: hypothetical protein KJ939_00830 [Nanoarchaeota archaeon]|nr:hypothetical protein [Nanoarchaeota archaeon]
MKNLNEENIENDNWKELRDLWYQLLELRQIEVSSVVADFTLLMGLGALLHKHKFYLQTSRVEEDLRLHIVWMIDSRAGKGEIINFLLDSFSSHLTILLPTSISDTVQIGSKNSAGNIVEGIYKNNDLVIHDEFENLFKSNDWNNDVFVNIRKNCDRHNSASNYLKNTKISTDDMDGFYGYSSLLLTSYPIENKVKTLLESGTFQRFTVLYEKVDKEKSNKIWDVLKQKDKEQNVLENALSKFHAILKRLVKQSIKGVALGSEAYNNIVDELKNETASLYDSGNEAAARVIRSHKVGQILQIQKIAAIITLVRGKPVIENSELEYARNLASSNFHNLTFNTNIFGGKYKLQGQWIKDIINALKDYKEPLAKMEINNIMAKYWGLSSPNAVVDRLKMVNSFVLDFVEKKGNTQYFKLKSIYGGDK